MSHDKELRNDTTPSELLKFSAGPHIFLVMVFEHEVLGTMAMFVEESETAPEKYSAVGVPPLLYEASNFENLETIRRVVKSMGAELYDMRILSGQ